MLAWQLCDYKGIGTSITEKPYIFVIFQWGGPDPLSPPLWIGTDILKFEHKIVIIFLSISLNMFFGAHLDGSVENPQLYVLVKK